MAVVTTNLGTITAYGEAVNGGYTGTKAEFQTAMNNYAQGITNASEALTKANANLANTAETYSTSATYAVGDYVIYNNQLYRCTTAITTAESWTAGHWTAVNIADDVSALNADLEDKLPYNSRSSESSSITETQLEFSNVGKLSDTTGAIQSAETAYKTTDYINIEGLTGIYRTGTTTLFALWIYCFYDSDYSYLGYKGSDSYTDYTIVTYNGQSVTWLDLDDYPTAKYVRISWVISRPYTYHSVSGGTTYKYDVPKITIDNIEPLKFYGKVIVNFGDSIFGNFRDTDTTTDKSISKMIKEATGATCYNAGFGGCTMTVHSNYWDAFTMHSLADSIASGDWSVQETGLTDGEGTIPSYFSETVAMLEGIDWNEVDYITIAYGTNDYSNNRFIEYSASFTNEWDYFKGALEYSIRTILTAYPHIRIAVISPCWRWFLADGEYSYSSDDEASANSRGLYLYDFVDACESVCKSMHIPYIDTYYTLGFNQYTISEYFPSADGTHPNQNGRQLRADRIIGQMNALF